MKETNTKQLTLYGLTWPIFVEMTLHIVMGNADTLMLSQYSDESVAAVGVSNQVLSVVIVMFGFVAQGAAVLIAQNLGADKKRIAREISVISMSLNLIFSLTVSALLYFGAASILRMMDLPQELMGEATIYMQIVGGLIFSQSLIMTAGAVLRSYGHTKDMMVVTIGMNILNVLGNYLVIFGPFGFPVLGVEGVAYSTVISRFLGLVAILYMLIKRGDGEYDFSFLFRYRKDHVKGILAIGLPSAGEQLSYNASQMVITYFVAQMGTIALTAKVYTQNVMMFIFLFAISIGQGTQILIGHMVGAGEFEDAYKRAMKSLNLSILISFLTAGLVYLIAAPLLGIFTEDSTILEIGVFLLLLTVALEPGRAFNIVMISSLRAAGDVRFPVYIGIISMWGAGVTIAWFLGVYLNMGLVGIWISFLVDEWLRGLLMLRRWRQRGWESMHFVQRRKTEHNR